MPESSSIHHEQEQLAKFSMSLERKPVQPEVYDDDDEEEVELQDIGELLGFRVTGGRDFFMPITIFHVSWKASGWLGEAIKALVVSKIAEALSGL